MPLYEFLCETCGSFEKRRPFAEASDPMNCPSCENIVTRIYSSPSLYKMAKSERIAHSRNEKSAHEPKVEVRSSGDGDTSSHHHHHHHHRHPTKKHHHGPSRPWMVGHN